VTKSLAKELGPRNIRVNAIVYHCHSLTCHYSFDCSGKMLSLIDRNRQLVIHVRRAYAFCF
jgi:hypothetical protein